MSNEAYARTAYYVRTNVDPDLGIEIEPHWAYLSAWIRFTPEPTKAEWLEEHKRRQERAANFEALLEKGRRDAIACGRVPTF